MSGRHQTHSASQNLLSHRGTKVHPPALTVSASSQPSLNLTSQPASLHTSQPAMATRLEGSLPVTASQKTVPQRALHQGILLTPPLDEGAAAVHCSSLLAAARHSCARPPALLTAVLTPLPATPLPTTLPVPTPARYTLYEHCAAAHLRPYP